MKEVKSFLVEVYSDPREVDYYAAWVKVEDQSYISEEEQVGDKIYDNDELWDTLMQTHVDNYGKNYLDDEDEDAYYEWADCIGAHVSPADIGELSNLKIIIDERGTI